MARVKRAVHGAKAKRTTMELAKGYRGQPGAPPPGRQRAGHALPALRLPGPAGAQG